MDTVDLVKGILRLRTELKTQLVSQSNSKFELLSEPEFEQVLATYTLAAAIRGAGVMVSDSVDQHLPT